MIKIRRIIFWIIFVSIIMVTIISVSALHRKSELTNHNKAISTSLSNTITSQVINTLFTCSNGKTIKASFNNNDDPFVNLTLSDGRTIRLSQTISASGARYATENDLLVFWNKENTAFIEENGTTTFTDCFSDNNNTTAVTTTSSLANPASVNCEQYGGQLQIATRPDGGQYGLCYFEDNRACEEWAMMRGDCPIGGMRTTGYDTIEQKFCAWSGGQTISAQNAICTFNDGSTCNNKAFYTGACQPGNKTKSN